MLISLPGLIKLFFMFLAGTMLSSCLSHSSPAIRISPLTYPESWCNTHLSVPVSGIWLPLENRELLLQLIEEGLVNNSLLRSRAIMVDVAVQQALIAGADSIPQLSGYFQGGVEGNERSSGDSYSLGLDLRWELDIWGKLDDRERAAVLDARISVEDWRQSRLDLIAEIASQWFVLQENLHQLSLIEQREKNLADNFQIIEEGYRMGLNSSLDLHLSRADLSATRARVEARQREMRSQTRRMEYLLGRYPATELTAAGDLPAEMAEIPAGIPADILTRRPDILASSYTLAASNLRLAAAYKNRFPSLRLTGAYGAGSDSLSRLVSSESILWSLVGGLTAPLFDGGRLAAVQDKEIAVARRAEALYRNTVLSAFVQVENGLEAEQRLKKQQYLLEQAVADSARAEELAFEQYRNGLVSYVTVLESERRAFDARSSVLSIYNERMQNRIKLFLALGGDFPYTEQESSFIPTYTDHVD